MKPGCHLWVHAASFLLDGVTRSLPTWMASFKKKCMFFYHQNLRLKTARPGVRRPKNSNLQPTHGITPVWECVHGCKETSHTIKILIHKIAFVAQGLFQSATKRCRQAVPLASESSYLGFDSVWIWSSRVASSIRTIVCDVSVIGHDSRGLAKYAVQT
jgi:hypothetical protein